MRMVMMLFGAFISLNIYASEFIRLDMYAVEKFIFKGDEYHIKLTLESSTGDQTFVQFYRKTGDRREYVYKTTLNPVKNNFGEFRVTEVVSTLVKSYPGERFVVVCAQASSVNGGRDEKCTTLEIEE